MIGFRAGYKVLFSIVALALAPIANAIAADYVVTPTRVIYPGQKISEDMIERVELKRPMANAHRAIKELDAIIGQTAIRTILPNRLIFESAFQASAVIEAGQKVTVIYNDGAIQMSMSATALEDGVVNDQIRIRNTESGRTFVGRVDKSGTILVGDI